MLLTILLPLEILTWNLKHLKHVAALSNCPVRIAQLKFRLIIFPISVVISNTGKVLGKSRKNHIPRIGDFNEVLFFFQDH